MKRILLLLLFAHSALAQLRPVHTFSIVARDPKTGEMGVAVQSHWFAVGQIVPWAEAGVGAVATQSFVDPSYGQLGLELLRTGKSPPEALPVGARDIVTVQLEVAPEATELGAHDKLDTAGGGGFTVTEAVAVPFNVAVTVTVWLLATVPAVAVKFAVVAPAATVTDAGTVSVRSGSTTARSASMCWLCTASLFCANSAGDELRYLLNRCE